MDYPTSLPPLHVISSFAATEADNVIRTAMDTGPAKVRRRSTAAPLHWRMGHPAYTKVQLATFLQFYREDTAHGALPFGMEDPLSGGVIACRFAAPPQWSARGADLFSISVDLEILP